MKNKKTSLILLLCGLFSVMVLKITAFFPYFVEYFYARFLYQKILYPITTFIRVHLRFINIGELLFYMFFVIVFFTMAKGILKALKNKHIRDFYPYGRQIISIVSIVIILFVWGWGLNYNRPSLLQLMELEEVPINSETLTNTYLTVLEDINALADHPDILRDDETFVMIYDGNPWYAGPEDGYDRLKEELSLIEGMTIAKAKGLYSSYLLNYADIAGIFSPFTLEPFYNKTIPDAYKDQTAAHEVAHSLGFAHEDEANFLAYLSCSLDSNPAVQYSGQLLALTYLGNALYRLDSEAYYEIREDYHPYIEADLKASSDFWRQFEGPIQEASNQLNDTYLKANNQESGILSYSEIVHLLVAYLYEGEV